MSQKKSGTKKSERPEKIKILSLIRGKSDVKGGRMAAKR